MSSIISRRAIASIARSNRFTSVRAYTDGPGGPSSGNDAFSDREKAQENLYIKKHEKEQLAKLREQLKQQKDNLSKLEQEIDSLGKK